MCEIVDRLGKSYTSTPVPKGLPRYCIPKECFYNCQRAVMDDKRLTYVEGLARKGDHWIDRAWVTLDGVHAIDLTLRGRRARWSKANREAQRQSGTEAQLAFTMDAAEEYRGVEIPRRELARLIMDNGYGSLLIEWQSAS